MLLGPCLVVAALACGQTQPKAPADSSFLRDYAQTRGFMLGRPVKATPTPDGTAVLFLRAQPRVAKLGLYEFDVAGGTTRELLTPEQVLKGADEKLTPEEKARRERMRVSVGGFTSFHISDDSKLILLSLSGRLYVVTRGTNQVRELKTGPGVIDPKFSPDSARVSYVRDHDLYLYDLAAEQEKRLTTGGTPLVSHGLAEFVAQEEMGRFTGYWWSPDARHIIYQESDARGVEVWYVADPIRPEQTPTPFFYPRPGKDNVKVKLAILAIADGATTWIQWDRDKYPYLATVRWTKGGPPLLAVQTRDQTEVAVLEADVATGKTTPLLVERDPAWVNLHQEAPRWLPDGAGYLWVSERDGGPQLEVRAKAGRLRQVVVPLPERYQGLVDVDAGNKFIYYTASADPTQTHLFRVQLHPFGEGEKLTDEPGMHSAVFAKNHSVSVRAVRPRRGSPATFVHDAAGKRLGELPSVAESPPFTPRVELQTGGKSAMHAAVVLPRNFEPRKRYPVLVDVYGGPHHVHVTSSEYRWLLDQWYADQGFIVVAIDGRGTPGRGRDWERAIYQKFADLPLDDQIDGLQALAAKYPAMDLKRVGIQGWSFGGYMAALAVLRRPDVFHAGVAGAPVADWLDYDTHYTERYLGIPPKDDAAYKTGSLLSYTSRLRRPLMILHGTADDNVYFRHSLKLADSLFRHGKDFEMVPLSGLTHMVPDPNVMERLHQRIAGFMVKHLGRPE
ncbi:MAG: S9 family peptidase [Gemmataceae bacterium]|nr:S9 family peptidase [Gemmataceae bacterium]